MNDLQTIKEEIYKEIHTQLQSFKKDLIEELSIKFNKSNSLCDDKKLTSKEKSILSLRENKNIYNSLSDEDKKLFIKDMMNCKNANSRRKIRIALRDTKYENGELKISCCWGTQCDKTPVHPTMLTIEHVIRRCDGGSNHKDNIRLACEKCNSSRHALVKTS